MFILSCLYNGESSPLIEYTDNFENERCLSYIMTLVRKQLISNNNNSYSITQDGKEYYEQLLTLNKGLWTSKLGRYKEIRKEGFDEWWGTYPANSKWEDKATGTKFLEARPLRTGKEQCKKKYDVLINTGKITHQQLIDSLKYEIRSRKIDSLRTNKNQLCFMKNSLSYLNQEAYLAFAEEIVLDPGFIQSDDDISHDDIYDSNTELGN